MNSGTVLAANDGLTTMTKATHTAVGPFQFSANDRWITTLAARFGVAADNWLFYAKGGEGWVGVNNPTITNVNTGGSISVSNSNSQTGWLAGGASNGVSRPTGRPD